MAALVELPSPIVAETKISVRGITKRFAHGREQLTALQAIDLEVRRGEFLCVVGPSGCGKSTLLHIIAGLEKPLGGEVRIDDIPTNGPGPDRILIFQDLGLFPWLSVRENVEFGLKMKGLSRRERADRARHFIRLVHLSQFENSYIHQLSGGMRQRVSLARALALAPSVLLMDEPFTALDAQTRDLLHDELERIWAETRQTILFVTHNVREAVRLGDRVVVMTYRPGRIKREFGIELDRPRALEDPEVAAQAAEILAELRGEIDQAVRAEYSHA
ncbi:ABC transporter, ATPase subunit [Candidatus Koribacter versatilis Ellin345]|uniref:ABC transporter, ATPase subunit n=1 Tax=Koribacter versatilis (strain Ellin345) TaxID=204669 RepID=Q1ITG9_KORVE|nr:ABC transporter ATP-binding protein [Candidatus Koribacter versatilis]ABF39831.1 ABC transporter, ATPase subunit [Candidatus Koribacter versatilis Ellin345]